MELVEEIIARMFGIEQLLQFRPQALDLLIAQDADAGEIAVFVKEANLLITEAIPLPFIGGTRQCEQIANEIVTARQIFDHDTLLRTRHASYGDNAVSLPGSPGDSRERVLS